MGIDLSSEGVAERAAIIIVAIESDDQLVRDAFINLQVAVSLAEGAKLAKTKENYNRDDIYGHYWTLNPELFLKMARDSMDNESCRAALENFRDVYREQNSFRGF